MSCGVWDLIPSSYRDPADRPCSRPRAKNLPGFGLRSAPVRETRWHGKRGHAPSPPRSRIFRPAVSPPASPAEPPPRSKRSPRPAPAPELVAVEFPQPIAPRRQPGKPRSGAHGCRFWGRRRRRRAARREPEAGDGGERGGARWAGWGWGGRGTGCGEPSGNLPAPPDPAPLGDPAGPTRHLGNRGAGQSTARCALLVRALGAVQRGREFKVGLGERARLRAWQAGAGRRLLT